MTELVTVPAQVKRDNKGRPLIVPPGGGKAVPYTRCTTYVSCLEDLYNLQRWQQRMVILGLVDRPDLLLSAAAHREDKDKLNRIADDAIEAAKAGASATIGTAIHALCERLDAGQDIGTVPGEYQRDLDAYIEATKPLTVLHSETFTVLDDLRIGGTPDRIVEFDGERYIADIKTGSIEWGAGKIAMQLAVYAHSVFYDHTTGQRAPLPGVNGQRGIVIHLPAGTGTCQLQWVNIAAGWDAVRLATQVRDWRARKGLLEPVDTTEQAALTAIADAGLIEDPIVARINAATSRPDIEAIWAAHETSWTPEHTAAATARITQLAQTA